MIDGLALDYTAARIGARLGWRPDERQWQRLHAARSLRALLDAARGAAVGNYLSGLAADADADAIDATFRAQFRSRVAELTSWAPTAWRAAVRWTAHLADLAAVAHLWKHSPLSWMEDDPVLEHYVRDAAAADARRTLLLDGPLAPLGRALLAGTTASGRPRRKATQAEAVLPVVLTAWLAHWQSLWPASGTGSDREQRKALQKLAATVQAHRARFGQLPPADTQAARATLAARMLALLRVDPAQPVALFAYLTLLALDLERLRAECLQQAFDADRDAQRQWEGAGGRGSAHGTGAPGTSP